MTVPTFIGKAHLSAEGMSKSFTVIKKNGHCIVEALKEILITYDITSTIIIDFEFLSQRKP